MSITCVSVSLVHSNYFDPEGIQKDPDPRILQNLKKQKLGKGFKAILINEMLTNLLLKLCYLVEAYALRFTVKYPLLNLLWIGVQI